MARHARPAAAAYVVPETPYTDVVGEDVGIRVVFYEDVARRGMGTLRWRNEEAKNWRRKATGRVVERDAKGEVTEEYRAWAHLQAMKKVVELGGTPMPEEASPRKKRPLTLGDTEAVLTDPDTGPYPSDTEYRRELLRALAFASKVLGSDRAWATIGPDEWTTIMRRRMTNLIARERIGWRGTETFVIRLSTIATRLKEHGKIPADAAVLPPRWKDRLLTFWQQSTKRAGEPPVDRPRHTLEELRKILGVAFETDARVGLMLVLGAELRGGQVLRSTRSDLSLDAGPHGELQVRGAGKKGGETIELTKGQRMVLDVVLQRGYLAAQEARFRAGEIKDYPLFPAGWLAGERRGSKAALKGVRPAKKGTRWHRTMHRRAALRRFHAIEIAAGITPVKGRGWYGARRQAVDAAIELGVPEQALQALGGWASPDVPRGIYADQENKLGRRQAREARADIRGESSDA